jgi:hypothetical protein
VARGDLPVDPVVLPFLRETAWNLLILFTGSSLTPILHPARYRRRPPKLRLPPGSRKKTMGRRRNRRSFRYDHRSAFQLGRVVMAALLIILLVLILVRLLQ